jgi:hypothetical protein
MPNLESLSAPGVVTIRGKQYTVLPIDGYGMQMFANVAPGDRIGMIQTSYKVAARCIGISFDEAFGTETSAGFSEQEIAQIMEAAQGKVKEVEASVKNEEAAGDKTNLSLAG